MTAWSRTSSPRVEARTGCASSRAIPASSYKGRAVDVREAAKQLGVRYVLEGSVRKSGNRIRITAQLIDATDGAHVWAERYDRAIDDIFAIQDEITLVLATEMQVKLTEGEQARLRYTTTNNVEAWTCWAQGFAYYRQARNKENSGAARRGGRRRWRSIRTRASLNAMLGWTAHLDARFGWWDDRDNGPRQSARLCRARARTRSEQCGRPHYARVSFHLAGCLRGGRVPRRAKRVELAPGSADMRNRASFVLTPAGYPEEAAASGEKSIALNPNYPAGLSRHPRQFLSFVGTVRGSDRCLQGVRTRAAPALAWSIS